MTTKLASKDLADVEAFKVGRIFNTSWGYDQTNVEFYEVVRESKASVWLREVGQYAEGGRVYPVAGRFLGEPRMHRKQGYRFGDEIHVHLRLDYVRFARPYEGGGKYETYAAGGAGH